MQCIRVSNHRISKVESASNRFSVTKGVKENLKIIPFPPPHPDSGLGCPSVAKKEIYVGIRLTDCKKIHILLPDLTEC